MPSHGDAPAATRQWRGQMKARRTQRTARRLARLGSMLRRRVALPTKLWPEIGQDSTGAFGQDPNTPAPGSKGQVFSQTILR